MLYYHHGIGSGFSGGYHEYFGGDTDGESLLYLTMANYMVHTLYPECMTVAEVRTLIEGDCVFSVTGVRIAK